MAERWSHRGIGLNGARRSRRAVALAAAGAVLGIPGVVPGTSGPAGGRPATCRRLPVATGRDLALDSRPWVRFRARDSVDLGAARVPSAVAAARLDAFVRGTPVYAAAVFFDRAPRGRCAEAAALAAAVRRAGGRAYDAAGMYRDITPGRSRPP